MVIAAGVQQGPFVTTLAAMPQGRRQSFFMMPHSLSVHCFQTQVHLDRPKTKDGNLLSYSQSPLALFPIETSGERWLHFTH